MRMISAGLFISLDGVVENPSQWGFQYMTPEMSKGIASGIAQADTVLIGRRTYLEFAQIWPGQGSQVPMADFLNHSPKYVVSSTLERLDWQPATLVKGDLVEQITYLKQQPGKNIQVPGSPSLVRFLINNGLLDAISLTICPIVVGAGMRLFDGMEGGIQMKLLRETTLNNGTIGATYQPVPNGSEVNQHAISFPEAAVRK